MSEPLNPFVYKTDKHCPITREEFERFCGYIAEEGSKPPKREILLMVHPRDFEAAKRFWNLLH